MSRLSPFVSVLIIATLPGFAATKPSAASSSQALMYAAQAIAALTGGNAINDLTLTGTATWTAGSDTENGTVTLTALGPGESRMDLALTSGTRTEIRDAQTGIPLGKWAAGKGSGLFAVPNCQTDAVWFFPALGSLTAGSNVILSYIGQETRNDESVQHLQAYIVQPSLATVFGITTQSLSTVDFYLDAATLLPSAIAFNAHPDTDARRNLPVEIDFSRYQSFGGINVPMHIQKYLQGTLLIDLNITSATFNTGIPLSTFNIN